MVWFEFLFHSDLFAGTMCVMSTMQAAGSLNFGLLFHSRVRKLAKIKAILPDSGPGVHGFANHFGGQDITLAPERS